MKPEDIKISKIKNQTTVKKEVDCYVVCWIQKKVDAIEINKQRYPQISNAIFFLRPDFDWIIRKEDSLQSVGYIMYIPKTILDNPRFQKLHINEVRYFCQDQIPKINLAPGIEKRIQAILEMLDELLSTHLKHRSEAILALLSTFFVYCDGKCNIKSVLSDQNAKSTLVYKFKKAIDQIFRSTIGSVIMLGASTFQTNI